MTTGLSPEVLGAIEAARARTPKPGPHRLKCGFCGHEDSVPNDPARSIYVCDECGTRHAFGVVLPRVILTPENDKRFIALRFQWGGEQAGEASFALDRAFGTDLAMELLSVCSPTTWQALVTMADRAKAEAATRVALEPTGEVTVAEPPRPRAPTPTTPESAPDGTCPCGQPSVHANGACSSCLAKALGG